MNGSVQVTFHHTPHSKHIKEIILDKLDKLEERFKRITSCKVVIDQPHNHLRKGNEYQVEVVMSIPHITATGHAHNTHMHTAVLEAIDTAAKQITKSIDKRRSKRDRHPRK